MSSAALAIFEDIRTFGPVILCFTLIIRELPQRVISIERRRWTRGMASHAIFPVSKRILASRRWTRDQGAQEAGAQRRQQDVATRRTRRTRAGRDAEIEKQKAQVAEWEAGGADGRVRRTGNGGGCPPVHQPPARRHEQVRYMEDARRPHHDWCGRFSAAFRFPVPVRLLAHSPCRSRQRRYGICVRLSQLRVR